MFLRKLFDTTSTNAEKSGEPAIYQPAMVMGFVYAPRKKGGERRCHA